MISPITLQFRLFFHSLCLHKYEWETEIEPINVETCNKII